ncbi:MAG: type II toxin-antitoxin system VapC family toxin [Candidatus Eisenbacteria bacterium]|nr:type II toxin-antitoxin system VapC family toxin [Candidatus Eisenbacteria bacterium]
MIALDASAFLAFLFREDGHESVAGVLDQCCMSTVNLAEVTARFVRDGHDARAVLERLLRSGIEMVPFSAAEAGLTAALVPSTQSFGLSLGDRACLALALSRRIPAYTADRVWRNLTFPVEIVVIR